MYANIRANGGAADWNTIGHAVKIDLSADINGDLKVDQADVTELATLQQRMLNECASLVKVGGSLIYSVCTLLAAESIEHEIPAGFERIREAPAGQWRAYGDGWRLLPHDAGTDGMIVLRYRRTQ